MLSSKRKTKFPHNTQHNNKEKKLIELNQMVVLGIVSLLLVNIIILVWVLNKQLALKAYLSDSLDHKALADAQADLRQSLLNQSHENQLKLEERLSQLQQKLQANLHQGFRDIADNDNKNQFSSRKELARAIKLQGDAVGQQVNELNRSTEKRLDQISERVNQKLSQGFEQSMKTFNDILQRLALIDEAQKKISELSNNVVSLQSVLADKRSRGAFGEVQLYSLLENSLAPNQYKTQATLSNGKIADSILELPAPTGRVVVDSKFPLESYQRMTDMAISESDRVVAERQFKLDIKKHIDDIANKYILPPETADSAILFLPAEAIFAEIHAHHNDLVDLAWRKRVWLTSPTTLMAVLTTAKAVLKDEATRQQVHLIQQHLVKLSADFSRFGQRFDQLARHIDQAATDVKQIHTSAQKISGRFDSIENLNLDEEHLLS